MTTRVGALISLLATFSAHAANSQISAVGAIEDANCRLGTIKVLGITFDAKDAGSSAAVCHAGSPVDLRYVSVSGETGSDGKVRLRKLTNLSIGRYVPGATLVYLTGSISAASSSTGNVVLSGAVVSLGSANANVGSVIEILGTQPLLGGSILPTDARIELNGLKVALEPETGLDSSIGSGTSLSSSIGSGKNLFSSIGSGANLVSSIGSGAALTSSIGSGTSLFSSIGSGSNVKSSIGSGTSLFSSIGSGTSITSSIGSGVSLDSSIGSGASLTSSIGSGTKLISSIGSGTEAKSSIGSGTSLFSSIGSGASLISSIGSGTTLNSSIGSGANNE